MDCPITGQRIMYSIIDIATFSSSSNRNLSPTIGDENVNR
jgi:hypothetical protein